MIASKLMHEITNTYSKYIPDALDRAPLNKTFGQENTDKALETSLAIA